MGDKESNTFYKRFLGASFAIGTGKPAYMRSLRVSILLGLPIIVGLQLGEINIALLFMMAALNVSLVDMGGMTYKKTAQIMLLTTLLNTLAAIVAQLAAQHIVSAFIVTFIWLAAVAMLGLIGNAGVMMALVNSVIFVLMAAQTGNQHGSTSLFLIFMGGGLWAVLFSIFGWPISPYRPIRKAVAKCFAENAAYLKALAELQQKDGSSSTKQTERRKARLEKLHQTFYESLNLAREMLAVERKTRFNHSDIEDSLIALLRKQSIGRQN
jgi:uncharacterized membrane protein YccC